MGGVETDGVYYNPSSDKTLAQAEAENNANDGMIRIGGAYFDAMEMEQKICFMMIR
ncbi:hypothetical protein [Weeksella virosa]|uniref:hypothetical protein n=1 Tax=Weeksella virosa TaxID=1014 RepID=UPI0015F12364|nr:hypothetical protein [Weeksella virosa]